MATEHPTIEYDPFNSTLENTTYFPEIGDESNYHPFRPFHPELMPYAVPILGYLSPFLICVNIVTNTLVVIVLFKKNMRSSTNYILAGMALSDMLTGIFPLPVLIYFYGAGNYNDHIPYPWCYIYKYFQEFIPIIFHTASIWLTMGLAIQRYIYICHSYNARKWCTIRNVKYGTCIVYVISVLSQVSRFIDFQFKPVEIESMHKPNVTITTCLISYRPWFQKNQTAYFNVYFWFRVICVHLIPCFILVILNALLISAMRTAQLRRMQLLKQNKKSESKKLKDSNCTTLMLVAVVGLFLVVEFPLGIIMILSIIENTFDIHIFDTGTLGVSNMISNFFILLSYPLNFFIYCGMSRQFRETFKRMFTGAPLPADKDCSQYCTIPNENGKTVITGECNDTCV